MQWLCVAGNNVQEIPAQIAREEGYGFSHRDKAKRQGLPLSKICPSFTQWLFPFCPPSDYCLTTIFQKTGKPWEPRRCKGFHSFCKSVLILWDVPETRMKPGFLPWRPDNSDSVGRWFESSRAHQNLQRNGSFGGFLLPIITLKKGKVYRNRDTDLGIRENLCSSQMVVKIRNYS